MKRSILLLVVVLLLCSCTKIKVTSVEVAAYKDNKEAAISFTYDDGMLCHYTDIAPQLEKRGFRGTFWIIGANMDTDSPDYPWMTWAQVADLSRRGHEISNHSWHHPNLPQLSEDSLRWEVDYCDSVLESVIGHRPRTFCYPYNAMSESVVRICSENRVGTRTYQASHGQIVSHQTADSLTNWLNGLLADSLWGVTMTHGTTYGWDYWTEPEILYNFFDEVKAVENRVWVGTFEQVGAYTQEVKDVEVSYAINGTVCTIIPKLRSLSSSLFNEPLTFIVRGDFIAGRYFATQQGRSIPVVNKGGQLLLNAVPDGTPVEIRMAPLSERVPMNGEAWLDTDGDHINAHGGNIIRHEGVWYWYGESRPNEGGTTEAGISVYSSRDLIQWKNCGIALATIPEEGHDIEPGCIMERPKVVYCSKTGKFVMLFHLELKGQGYRAARVAFAQSDSPVGPFTFLRSTRTNAGCWPENVTREEAEGNAAYRYLVRDMEGGQMSRDMTVYVDEESGKAYQITASEENGTLHFNELTDDYLDFTGKYVTVAPGAYNEAPVILKHDGKFWLICSGCTGWAPNQARLYSADSLLGPWSYCGNPCSNATGLGYLNAGADRTFHAQGTYCLQPAPGKYIFMADIWNPEHLRQSLHLWLPVQFKENGEPFLPWTDCWL